MNTPMTRQQAIHAITLRRAVARGMPEHIARTTADRAARLNRAGHSAHRAMYLADGAALAAWCRPNGGKS